MIRKNRTVLISQIYKIRAHIAERNRKSEWNQTYIFEEVIIGNLKHAQAVYAHELNNMKPSLMYNHDSKKAKCALFVPLLYSDGSLSAYPYDEKTYIELFEHNL